MARGYNDDPALLLEFLDGFVVRHKYDERETELLGLLADNGAEVARTTGIRKQIRKDEEEESRLTAALKAATEGRVEDIAKWATILASQGPMLDELGARISMASALRKPETSLSLEEIAAEFGVDLRASLDSPSSGLG